MDTHRPFDDSGDDHEFEMETRGTRIRCRDGETNVRVVGLVVCLLGIFGGIAFFLSLIVRAPAHAASRSTDDLVTHAPEATGSAAGDSTPGPLRPHTRQPASEPVAVSRETGAIEIELHHEVTEGRLLVALGDRTVLSKPIDAESAARSRVRHSLSVPAGSHTLVVEILGDWGQVLADAAISVRIETDRTVRLLVKHRAGATHSLNLKQVSAAEADTEASFSRSAP